MALAPEQAGIGIRRHFTTDGVHPYDEVEWDRRDARITNFRDGSVAFEQVDVEFPTSWSLNATNIVAQKYFRGTLGTPEREWSLRQVVDRVADTITRWGTEGGYFVDADEAEAFNAELKHLLVTQKAAFNSPVWFNIGVKGVPQQASACQPYDAPVSTPDGYVAIGDLVERNAVGTKVYDSTGVTRVVATKHNGRKPVLRLHAKAGHMLDVTSDHLVWRSSGQGTGSFVSAGELRPGDKLEWHRTYAHGTGEITTRAINEASLAGWLQSDGFVERWDLRTRGAEMTVPESLFAAPLPVVAAYLRSLFHAEGYVSVRERSAAIGLDMISEGIVRGSQALLARFGIFSRVRFKADPRGNRHGCWSLSIRSLGDRRAFADEIGFIDPAKVDKLNASLDLAGRPIRGTKRLEIDRIEPIGEMDVYDIQTESGEYLSGNLRVHNCFILSVDDDMDSILNWYREEGVIFKGGSGAGVNLSRIRSSVELLKGGGTASGPVSFMRGADASAGTIKSGGKTRRAAKMVILDISHPDIEEFIWCKALEERKARVLEQAGFDMDLDGRDSHSIQYQNANNSVRVTDDFMQAVVDDGDWSLREVTTGNVVKTVRARELFRQLCKATWECADPGMQFDTTINHWHTAANTGRINGSNPCSEYMHLDDSACNLASLNVLKFLNDDESFDVDGFRHAVEVLFTGQEILVGRADYPTEGIADTSRRFRQLGIGYANIGALLMALGLPYDSDAGRAYAAAITSLMTGHAYEVSARTASRMGPFAGFAENREHMLGVLGQHQEAASKIDEELVPPELLSAAQESWDMACELGERYGVRNSQASVLAPTGTIGLMMDCDTTGIEPDLALVKTKKLVGGGTMSIVNQTVPRALEQLGYGPGEIDDIVAYIDEHKSIVGAPNLLAEHMPVFACSMGDNVIHYSGHVRMMAAVQPFISGAISKTVNMPEEATVEEVEQLHIDAWRMGVKAIAIYRDNCKVGQPLSTTKKAGEVSPGTTTTTGAAGVVEQAATRVVEKIIKVPVREKLPRNRTSSTFEFRVADCKGFVTIGEYDDGRPGEIFLRVSKQGSTLAGIMDAFSISVSYGLQYGVPLRNYVEAFTNTRFEPAGITDDADLRIATSILDYIFRRLAVNYLSYEERAELGILTTGERTQPTLPGVEETVVQTRQGQDVPADPPSFDSSSPTLFDTTGAPKEPSLLERAGVTDAEKPATGKQSPAIRPPAAASSDAPYCMQCGVQMQRAGSCHACPSCGSTSGCS
jgi:ribonucleoside-diphosphate reductase alpha chain